MAITKYKQPGTGIFSTDRRVHAYLNTEGQFYSCLSDNVTNNNFMYIFRVKTKDGYLSKVNAPPYTNSIGLATVNNKLESLFSYTFQPTITSLTSVGANRLINYHLYVEEYYENIASTIDATFTKCIAAPIRLNGWNFANYIMPASEATPSSRGRFLSDFITDRKVMTTEHATISWLNGQFLAPDASGNYTSKGYRMKIEVHHDSTGLNYDTYKIEIDADQFAAWTNLSSDNDTLEDMTHRMIEAPAGPINLNAATKTWILNVVAGVETVKNSSTTNTIIQSTDDHYKLYLHNLTDVSEYVKYNIIGQCPDYTSPIRFAWVNYLGGTDYFTFNLISKKQLSVDRKVFERNRIAIDGTTPSYGTYDGGKTIFDTDWNEVYSVTSDILTPEESLSLESIWTSKNVYAYIGTTWYPIIITTNDVTIEDSQTNNPIRYNIEFIKSNEGFGVNSTTVNSSGYLESSNDPNSPVIK